MSSEAITRNDLTAIFNEVLPFSFTDFRYHKGTITVPNSTLVTVHTETLESGSWLILTTLKVINNGGTAETGQNRILVDGVFVYAHKDIPDNSIVNTNFYVLESASNTTVTLEAFQASGNSQSQDWTYTAIRIGDKFAPASDITTTVGGIQFSKSGEGKTVSVSGNRVATLSTGSYTSIGTLPSEYRPTDTRYIPFSCGNSANIFGTMRIMASGDVGLVSATAITNQNIFIGGSYIIA